jgi:hypothetical protein
MTRRANRRNHRPRVTVKAAAWIRVNAWRPAHRTTYAEAPAMYTACACQLDVCGYCLTGRHTSCTHERHEPALSAAGYLVNQRGQVLEPVYELGHDHRWTCTCKTAGHDGTPIQAALFNL